MSGGCKICGKREDTKRCKICKKVRYCGEVCQKLDWDGYLGTPHREECYYEKEKEIPLVYEKKEPIKPCPICFEEEEDEGNCGMCLRCGNVFCGFCNTVEKMGKVRDCPMCRFDMVLEGEERLKRMRELLDSKEREINKRVLYSNFATLYSTENHVIAKEFCQKSMDLGFHLAFTNMAIMIETTEKDLEKALPFFKKGASMRSALSQVRLAGLHEGKEEFLWYERAAENCDSGAQHNMGVLNEQKDIQKSIEWYTSASKNGYSLSLVNLGEIFDFGKGGIKKDEKLAANYYIQAYELHQPRACYHLGRLCQTGTLLPSEKETAIEFYEEGAEMGDISCITSLGFTLIERDEKRAVELLEKATSMGCAVAPYELGIYYLPDMGKSQPYFALAKERGCQLLK